MSRGRGHVPTNTKREGLIQGLHTGKEANLKGKLTVKVNPEDLHVVTEYHNSSFLNVSRLYVEFGL